MAADPASGRPLVQRAALLPRAQLLRHAAFVPPGYTSLLFAHLYEDHTCGGASSELLKVRGGGSQGLCGGFSGSVHLQPSEV